MCAYNEDEMQDIFLTSFLWQILCLTEENTVLDQSNKESNKQIQEHIAQLEELQKKHNEKEESLNATVESLAAELKLKSELQTQLSELEHKLVSTETLSREEASILSLKICKSKGSHHSIIVFISD